MPKIIKCKWASKKNVIPKKNKFKLFKLKSWNTSISKLIKEEISLIVAKTNIIKIIKLY